VVGFSQRKISCATQRGRCDLPVLLCDLRCGLGDLGDLAPRARLRSLRCASLRCAALLFPALRCASLRFVLLGSLRCSAFSLYSLLCAFSSLLRYVSHPPTRCRPDTKPRENPYGRAGLRRSWIAMDYRFISNLQYLSLRTSLSPSLSSHPLSLCPPNCEKPARSAYATRSAVAKERGKMRGERGRERVRETVVFRFCAAIVCSSLYSCVQTVIQSRSNTAPLAVQPMHVCFIRVCVFGI